MATIVTNVKECLHIRSRHWYSTKAWSIDDGRPPLPSVSINSWQRQNRYDFPQTLIQQALAESEPGDKLMESLPEKQLPEVPQEPRLGQDPDILAQSRHSTPTILNFPRLPDSIPRNPVPDRHSSLRRKDRPSASDGATKSHRRMASEPVTSSYVLPGRQSSLRPNRRHKPIATISPELGQYEAEVVAREKPPPATQTAFPIGNDSTQEQGSTRSSPRKDSLQKSDGPRGHLLGHRTARSVDVAPSDPSFLIPRHLDKEREILNTAGTPQAMKVPDDIRLPADFKLDNYERTQVSTSWLPAVTQEVVHRQRIEMVQKAITRDIHIHHYFEYFQPVKVIEVLPARHWFLDPETGKKTEIPEPTGWVMPGTMTPRKPDTTTLTKETRHYLVDDEHPNGLIEPPPEVLDDSRPWRRSIGSGAAAEAV